MSNARVSDESTPEETPIPPAVNQALVHLGEAWNKLNALVARQIPGNVGEEALEQGLNILTRATTRLLASSGRYIALSEQLEEREQQEQAAMHPLVGDPFLSCHDILLTDVLGRDSSRGRGY